MSSKCSEVKQVIYILILLLFPVICLRAQEKDSARFMIGIVQGNDTLIHKDLKEVIVFPRKMSRREERRYSRYVEKVKKVYPLALEARELLKKYEPQYYALDNHHDRRKLMKNLERELLAAHKEELKKWSLSDGRILLKLINRETERTPYSIIKDFRGDVSAIFWQGIARLFKNDLKDGYEPEGEDKWLEEIVVMIELGYL